MKKCSVLSHLRVNLLLSCYQAETKINLQINIKIKSRGKNILRDKFTWFAMNIIK